MKDIKTDVAIDAGAKVGLDLSALRERLAATGGQNYWRSLEELADTPEFRTLLHREFPPGAAEWWDGVSRRNFLKMAAASLALAGLTACTKQPPQAILPYVNQPEGMVLGQPLYYATAMVMDGFATGVLAKNREGHPIKVDGNPDHPSVLGGSSVWMQASILDLYDPDRSQGVAHHGEISTWALCLSDLNEMLREQAQTKGEGLRFLTETVTSPSLAAKLQLLLRQFPRAKWVQYEPLNRDHVLSGAQMAFGEVVETHYQFEKANVILSLDSDFLLEHPDRLRYARHFTNGRRVSDGRKDPNRLYVVESTPTLTGSLAEHRLPVASRDIEGIARSLAQKLGALSGPGPKLDDKIEPWITALSIDLKQHAGACIVIAGRWQQPVVHALAHLLNQQLGNNGKTVLYRETALTHPGSQVEGLRIGQ